MKRKYTEKGQALVLIVFGAVALFALAALAIDGSRVYSDKRHAQNAADTAALAGALAKAKGDLPTAYKAAAFTRALSNGYDNNTITNTVQVNDCNEPGITCEGLPVGAVAKDYIRVRIISTIPTTFARVLGRQSVTNAVEAVVHTVPSVPDEMFAGNAVVGLAPSECGAIKFQGNAGTTVTGGGLFIMSDCDNQAFFNNSGAGKLTAPSICAVGDAPRGPGTPLSTVPSVQSGCKPPPGIVEPNPFCSGTATWDETTGIMSPGSYSGTHFPPNHVHTLLPGTYCVDSQDFTINGGDTLTGIGVTIRMNSGDINWNGGAQVNLEAPLSPPNKGLLIYMPSASNCSTITLNGNSGSTIVGSILAPCSNIKIDGTGDSGINGQIIGYTVDLGGTSASKINYTDALNYDALTLPILESTQ
jgi:Flp pilus assembly protein TadG